MGRVVDFPPDRPSTGADTGAAVQHPRSVCRAAIAQRIHGVAGGNPSAICAYRLAERAFGLVCKTAGESPNNRRVRKFGFLYYRARVGSRSISSVARLARRNLVNRFCSPSCVHLLAELSSFPSWAFQLNLLEKRELIFQPSMFHNDTARIRSLSRHASRAFPSPGMTVD